MTAVAGATFTAAQFNTYVRDNLNETAPAKATAASQLFVATGANAITTRQPSTARVDTQQFTNSTSYVNLTTPGPAITVTCGTIAIVSFAASQANNTSDSACLTSVEVSGASTVTASDTWAILTDGVTGGNFVRYGMTHVFSGLTPGSNTFTMKYRAGSSTGNWQYREISVIPL
jgi:hypothetical protein